MRRSIVPLLLCLTAVHGLYEDQAGQHDWYLQHLGGIEYAEFAFKSRERVFLAAETNVVASLDLRDGSVAWRQVLAESEAVSAIALLPKPAAIATLSSSGKHLQLWQAHDGGLLWDQMLDSQQRGRPQDMTPQLLVIPDLTADSASELAIFANGELQVCFMHAFMELADVPHCTSLCGPFHAQCWNRAPSSYQNIAIFQSFLKGAIRL